MNFSSYEEFRHRLLMLIEETDEPSTDNITSLDTMIGLGEGLVHYGGNFAADGRSIGPLRASSMQADLSAPIADNAAPVPDDCLELAILWLADGAPLEIVAERDLRTRLRHVGGGVPRKAAQAGDSIIFSPAAADDEVLSGRYYARPAALKDELHPTFQRYPELYLYAALASAAPFYGMEHKLPVWGAAYSQLLDQANRQERMRVSAGGRLRQVSR